MRMTPAELTFRDHEWETICDALSDYRSIQGASSSEGIKATRLIREISERISD